MRHQRERLIAFVAALAEHLEQHSDLIRTAEATSPREDAVYRFYRTHVELLAREADTDADSEFIADALLAMLAARAFLYLRVARELPLERIVERARDKTWCAGSCRSRGLNKHGSA